MALEQAGWFLCGTLLPAQQVAQGEAIRQKPPAPILGLSTFPCPLCSCLSKVTRVALPSQQLSKYTFCWQKPVTVEALRPGRAGPQQRSTCSPSKLLPMLSPSKARWPQENISAWGPRATEICSGFGLMYLLYCSTFRTKNGLSSSFALEQAHGQGVYIPLKCCGMEKAPPALPGCLSSSHVLFS